MARLEASVLIRKPAEEVWAYVGDFARAPDWGPLVAVEQVRGDGPGSGSAYRIRGERNGRQFEGTVRITDFGPGALLGYQSEMMGVGMVGRYELHSLDGSTRVHWSADAKMRGLLRLLGPLVRRNILQAQEMCFERLRGLLED